MNLTQEQEEAIQAGEPVEVELARKPCIILPKETYQEMRETEPSPRETYSNVLKAIDQDDENPEQYLEYLEEA
jgi:hypothetical protein